MPLAVISKVMSCDMGLAFKRIQKVPLLGNTARCLLLRQMYAKFMLKLLAAGTRVINVDQTWLNDLNFHRRCWAHAGDRNTRNMNSVTPRLSMLMAIDTDGNLYAALTQVNTDHRVFCLFMTELVKKLTAENAKWRETTILLIDGAKYQTGKES